MKLAVCCLAAITLAGCGGAGGGGSVPALVLGPGEHVSAVPTRDPLGQTVAVAYLMPGMEIGVDVVSGRVYMATEVSLLPARYRLQEGRRGVIGLVDPQLHDRIFTYRSNAIPGLSGKAVRTNLGGYPRLQHRLSRGRLRIRAEDDSRRDRDDRLEAGTRTQPLDLHLLLQAAQLLLDARLAPELLALALAADLEEPLPQRPHQRCPGVLRGYCEIDWSRSIAVVTMRFCSAMCAAG